MNTYFKFQLEKGTKKHPCPECSKSTFVRYLDQDTKEYLPDKYGRCDRESKCGYHLNPYKDDYLKENKRPYINFRSAPRLKAPKPIVFFNTEAYTPFLSVERYTNNQFIQNLVKNVPFPFEMSEVTQVAELYKLGTVSKGYRAGGNTFPFIDINGNIRAVQVKQFDTGNHTTGTDYLHAMFSKHYQESSTQLPQWLSDYKEQDKFITCLFGEHLLNQYPNNPIALVEAPKTAIYGTLYFGYPSDSNALIWLATGSKSYYTLDRLKVLKGRTVIVMPDLSKEGKTFKEWEAKTEVFKKQLPNTRFKVSDLLERLAPQDGRDNGLDIADYLIHTDWRGYKQPSIQTPTPVEPTNTLIIQDPLPLPIQNDNNTQCEHLAHLLEQKDPLTLSWEQEIKDLELFFNTHEWPSSPIKLDQCSTILNLQDFISNHFEILKANINKKTFSPYLTRLNILKTLFIEYGDLRTL